MPYPCEVKEEADRILEEFDNICKELNIEYGLLLGTCLGLYRDGRYIEGDNDIDVGIICPKDGFKRLAEKLVKNGFIQESEGSQHFYKYDILLDIWRILPEKLLFSDSITYNGKIYKVPHPVEKYLEETYYGNWKNKIYIKGKVIFQ